MRHPETAAGTSLLWRGSRWWRTGGVHTYRRGLSSPPLFPTDSVETTSDSSDAFLGQPPSRSASVVARSLTPWSTTPSLMVRVSSHERLFRGAARACVPKISRAHAPTAAGSAERRLPKCRSASALRRGRCSLLWPSPQCSRCAGAAGSPSGGAGARFHGGRGDGERERGVEARVRRCRRPRGPRRPPRLLPVSAHTWGPCGRVLSFVES